MRAAHGGDVGLRIGIDTGEVIAGREAARVELMVTGDAVNVAARLQQLAEPGEVLVGARTKQATQRDLVPRPRRPRREGQVAPGTGLGRARSIRAARQRRDGQGPFVGREDEVAMLRLAASRVARERRPQLVTVFGQAGPGKSRLVAEFVAGLEDTRVLVGRCVPYGDGVTYLPLA